MGAAAAGAFRTSSGCVDDLADALVIVVDLAPDSVLALSFFCFRYGEIDQSRGEKITTKHTCIEIASTVDPVPLTVIVLRGLSSARRSMISNLPLSVPIYTAAPSCENASDVNGILTLMVRITLKAVEIRQWVQAQTTYDFSFSKSTRDMVPMSVAKTTSVLLKGLQAMQVISPEVPSGMEIVFAGPLGRVVS